MPTPNDPYAADRLAHGVAPASIGDQDFTLILRYDDVKAVARDWEHFTSATPFRVPIPEESDVRPVRQYPIETDPPEHRKYRDLIDARFSRAAAAKHQPAIATQTEQLLAEAVEVGTLDVREGLALPIVLLGITLTMGRPPEEAERLRSWGMHVFLDPETGTRRRNDDLDAYLADLTDAAIEAPGDDIFGDLTRAELDGRPLSRDEILGYGYLVLAGGRDTVIAAITDSLRYLGTNPVAQDHLRQHPESIPTAVEEFLRYFSPLGHIGRTVAAPAEVAGHQFAPGELVSLCWASANHDENAFDDPSNCRLDRWPNRHVAFGHGPHRCSGAPLARMELQTVLDRVLAVAPSFSVVGDAAPVELSAHAGTISDPHDGVVVSF